MKFNPDLDLVLERTIDITPEQAFKAWTDTSLFSRWFCPKPWFVNEASMDLRPGGLFYTVMNGPNGERFTNRGCILEVVKDQKLVWTDFFSEDFSPNEAGFMTVTLTFTPDGNGGTIYKAVAKHKTTADKQKHETMGFVEGWGVACDQLVAMIKSL